MSAKYGHGVDDVKDWILSKLPFGPAYYPKDITSEHPERFFVAEIVREKIFLQYRNEIPYACQVNVVSYKSRPNAKDFIQVEIVVEKNSQKIIVIGKEIKRRGPHASCQWSMYGMAFGMIVLSFRCYDWVCSV